MAIAFSCLQRDSGMIMVSLMRTPEATIGLRPSAQVILSRHGSFTSHLPLSKGRTTVDPMDDLFGPCIRNKRIQCYLHLRPEAVEKVKIMINFIPAPYSKIANTTNVFANNIKQIQGQYRLWRYIFDYAVEQPKLDPIPVKLKSKKGLSLFRYMNASHLLSDLKEQKLSFVSPYLWDDPFEKLFFEQRGVSICNIRYFIRCICFTYDWIESEEASWNRFSDTQEIVRVEYDYETLCTLLSKELKSKFYFSVMDYSMPRADIVQLHNQYIRGVWCPSSIGEYLNVLSLKRKAFSYENEIRLFMVSDSPFSDDVVRIDSSLLKMTSVCFPPKKQSVLPELERKLNDYKIKPLHSKLYDVK